MSAQYPNVQPQATFVSLRSKASRVPTVLEEWDQGAAPVSASEPTALALAMELFGDRIEMIEHMVGQCIEAISALAERDSVPPPATPPDMGLSEALARLEARLDDRLDAQVEALASRLKPLETSDTDPLASRIQTQLAQLEVRLDELATRPLPRPDMSDQRIRTAQILTAISTISHRQEAVMEQIEDRLATFVVEQDQRTLVIDTETVSMQLQKHLDTHLDAFERIQKEGDANREQHHKTLINMRKAFDCQVEKLVLKLDSLQTAPVLDTQILATQLCAALQDSRLQADATDMGDRANVAPELIRSLRFAVAETLADLARQTMRDKTP